MRITSSHPLVHALQAVLPTLSAPPVSVSPVTPTAPRVLAERSTNVLVVHPIGRSSQTDVASLPVLRINFSTRRLLPVKPAIPVVQVAPVLEPAPVSPVETRITRCYGAVHALTRVARVARLLSPGWAFVCPSWSWFQNHPERRTCHLCPASPESTPLPPQRVVPTNSSGGRFFS